jgi:hypothetical protein
MIINYNSLNVYHLKWNLIYHLENKLPFTILDKFGYLWTPTSLNNWLCHCDKFLRQSAWESMDLWNHHALWNMCLAAICLRDDVLHSKIRIVIDLHILILDHTIVVVIKILLRISVKMEMFFKKNSIWLIYSFISHTANAKLIY